SLALGSAEVSLLALTNAYDNLCNPPIIANALTPNEALSLMFAKQRSKYDVAILGRFVRILGVYPPGTVVLLSNEGIGMVLSINAAQPLRPVVIIYDAHIPKSEAMIVNLEQDREVNIVKALRPSQLPRPVYEYLSPRQRITYSFDQQGGGR
ncbi:MAG TPA: HD-GYP domain-containing protein, partial [Accumulibacter sp.]|nr:HD-GYP domain-containing protein [Accumulibacter sp.]